MSCAEQLHESTSSHPLSVLSKPNLVPSHTPSKTHTVQKNPKVTVTPNATPIQPKPIATSPQQLTSTPTLIQTTAANPSIPSPTTQIAQLLSTGAAKLANLNGKQVLVTNAEALRSQQQTGATSTAPTPPPTPQ